MRNGLIGAVYVTVAVALALAPAAAAKRANDPASYVNPFEGTDTTLPDRGTGGSAGGTFPGAVAPHGMVQWSPDTVPSTVNFAGGYTYGDSQLRGFSLTHISGPGCAALQDFPILPTAAPVTSSPAVAHSSDIASRYLPTFTHRQEHAQPGYYGVDLNPGSGGAIESQLVAAGPRTALGRFTYPRTRTASLLFNAGGSAMADYTASVSIDPGRRLVTGSAQSGEFCYQPVKYRLYFAAQFDRSFAAYGTWRRQTVLRGSRANSDAASSPAAILNYKPIPGGPPSIPGDPSGTAQTGAYVTFDGRRGRAVEVRVAISSVSAAQAVANLRSEPADWNLTRVRARMRRRWDASLGAIRVRGGSVADRTRFYTALYHALVDPHIYSDANGRYMGMDGRVHTARGYTQYADISGWDIYRTQIPLLAIIEPRAAENVVSSLLADQRQTGWLPKWPYQNQQTESMVGDPADAIIADVYAFGASRFDTVAALAAMVKGATRTGSSSTGGYSTHDGGYVERQALTEYERLHYVPEELNNGSGSSTTPYMGGGAILVADPHAVWGSAATTLEYTTEDFALARFAGALARPLLCRTFLARSAYWQSLFNPATGYLQPRYATGNFDVKFDPTQATGWVEGSTAQYTWMVPYDVRGLFARMGGPAKVRPRLDRFFTRLNAGPVSQYAFLGNEPTLETPWLYDWAGAPSRTQATVRRALLELYGAGVTDYPGNDDLGTMAAWVVFASLGLYPEIPGSDELVLASPLFPRAVVRLAHGNLMIDAPNAADSRPYVASASLNGRSLSRSWLRFAAVSRGGSLRFRLGSQPTRWASGTAPPSYSPRSAGVACRPPARRAPHSRRRP
jgi:predicted alpha-1,2-mannosidase